MDPISQKAAGGGAEIMKKMMEQGAGGPQDAPGGADNRSKFEQLRQDKLEGTQKPGEIDGTRKADQLDPTRQAGALDPSRHVEGTRTGMMDFGKSALDQLNSGHKDMEALMKRLESGGEMSMKEMLSMQMQLQRISHQVDMTTKLVGKAVENINKAINTQV